MESFASLNFSRVTITLPLSDNGATKPNNTTAPMNAAQRKAISEIREKISDLSGQLGEIKDKIEALRDEEQEKFDNLPEGLQQAENGQAMESAISNLEDAASSIDSAVSAAPVAYSAKELIEFRKLVEGTESRDQMRRINARFDMPAFVERVGKAKCDAMFEVLKEEIE
jgi:TolA-binding protein